MLGLVKQISVGIVGDAKEAAKAISEKVPKNDEVKKLLAQVGL